MPAASLPALHTPAGQWEPGCLRLPSACPLPSGSLFNSVLSPLPFLPLPRWHLFLQKVEPVVCVARYGSVSSGLVASGLSPVRGASSNDSRHPPALARPGAFSARSCDGPIDTHGPPFADEVTEHREVRQGPQVPIGWHQGWAGPQGLAPTSSSPLNKQRRGLGQRPRDRRECGFGEDEEEAGGVETRLHRTRLER